MPAKLDLTTSRAALRAAVVALVAVAFSVLTTQSAEAAPTLHVRTSPGLAALRLTGCQLPTYQSAQIDILDTSGAVVHSQRLFNNATSFSLLLGKGDYAARFTCHSVTRSDITGEEHFTIAQAAEPVSASGTGVDRVGTWLSISGPDPVTVTAAGFVPGESATIGVWRPYDIAPGGRPVWQAPTKARADSAGVVTAEVTTDHAPDIYAIVIAGQTATAVTLASIGGPIGPGSEASTAPSPAASVSQSASNAPPSRPMPSSPMPSSPMPSSPMPSGAGATSAAPSSGPPASAGPSTVDPAISGAPATSKTRPPVTQDPAGTGLPDTGD